MNNTAKPRQFVVNFHINEICNFQLPLLLFRLGPKIKSRRCFPAPAGRERVNSELWSLLGPSANGSPLADSLTWECVRLNIAGGEPLLYEADVLAGIKHARSLGFDPSIITNGSRLTADLARQLAPDLDWLGINIDSLDHATNAEIGGMDRHNRQISIKT